MFPSSRRPQSPTIAASAFRTARLLKALATLDLRPLDADGRPIDTVVSGDEHRGAPRSLVGRPSRPRRPGTAQRAEHCIGSRDRGDAGGSPALLR